jgi:hypothetical protein
MYRTAIILGVTLFLPAALGPAQAMEICQALAAAEETRTQVEGTVTAAESDTDYPYLFVANAAGDCEILVEPADKSMLANCAKGAHATAIGILRWDEEAAMFEDIDVNYLDEASVVCE